MKQLAAYQHEPNIITSSVHLSYDDILTLQNAMTKSGMHWFSVPKDKKRSLMMHLLSSFNHFQNAACLTMSDAALPHDIIDIYQELIVGKHITHNTLDFYFNVELETDFIWIEVCQDLLHQKWFKQIEIMPMNIPIIALI